MGRRTALSDHIIPFCRLRPHPLILVGHFFAVALYAIYQTVKTQSVLTIHRGVHRAMMIFIKACLVIFPLIGSEFVTLL